MIWPLLSSGNIQGHLSTYHQYFLAKVIHHENIPTTRNNGIFYVLRNIILRDCTIKRTYFGLHCAINHAETLPLKGKEANVVNEDLTVLLTTTMNSKRNQNLVFHFILLSFVDNLFFQEMAKMSPRFHCTEENKNVRAARGLRVFACRCVLCEPSRANLAP